MNTTWYFFSGLYEVFTQGETQAITKYYAIAGKTIAMSDGTSLKYFLTDHLGSIVAVLSSTGALISEQRYMPFGEVRNISQFSPVTETDFGYTFQKNLPSIGLMDYRARLYDPYLNQWTQPDTIIPNQYNSQSLNRYSYVSNNPINYQDPSGNIPEWLNSIGQFFTGFAKEFTRANNWVGAIVEPNIARSLSASSNESSVQLSGRIVADIATVALGVLEVVGGAGIAGGGAIVGCGATLCLASVPAVVAGATVITAGVATSVSGSAALGENLRLAFSKRSTNDLQPDPNATGPHTTYKTDPETGQVTNYETYQPQSNPQNPNPWQKILRYDGVGKSHLETGTNNYILPHVHDYLSNIVRNPYWYEIPK